MKRFSLVLVAILFSMAIPLRAGEVTVTGVHLCCGQCVKDATAAFEGVEGVTAVVVDDEAKTVKFTVANDEAVMVGLKALGKKGFGGAAKHGDKDVKFPNGGAKKDIAEDEITVRGLHNCCEGCATAIVAAIKGVEGVSEATLDKRICTVKGKAINHVALVQALHNAGLHGSVVLPMKKP